MPEPLVFLLQGFMVLAVAAVVLSALAWMTRTVLAWLLRRFGLPATADLPSLTMEKLAERQKLFEERRRMSDWGPTSIDATQRWLWDRDRLYGKGDGSHK